ncbi:MAG: formate dehydrogenase subunit alpha [Gammaproteobacteria bacterium]
MSKKINLTIDGVKITTDANKTILQAALENNIYIPNICYNSDLRPVGICRLCLVDIGHPKGPVTACNTPVTEGMKVKTETAQINTVRSTTIKLLLNYHCGSCLECGKNTHCELQKAANYIGIRDKDLEPFIQSSRNLLIDRSNPFFDYDPNKCILCKLCIRTCGELQEIHAIDYADRGYDSTVRPFNKEPWVESRCESCGECVVRCPTGALSFKKCEQPSREVTTTCPYCGCGCSLILGVRGNKIISSRGNRESQSNHGSLCVKGRFGYEFVNSPKRLTKPLIKRDEKFVESTWDEALDLIANKLKNYKKEKFAMFSSAKCTNEDNYVVQKFARAVMGTNNIDHCARLCHAPTVAGLAQSFGSGAMTNSNDEIGDAKCIFAIGTNTTEAHPIIALQVKRAARKGCKLIVANPRWIDLCRHAHIFLQHKPGTDVVLMMGMARVILDENLHDEKFIKERCENFDAFKKSLENFDLEYVAKTTGVPREKIVEAARIYATEKPGSILYAMGITQHTCGTDNVLATSNLAMLTGNVGKPSSGVNPLRGQNNVQGACDMAALPNVYPGYQKVTDKDAQKKFEKAWGVKLDDKIGLTHTEILTAIDKGIIKSVYVVGENPILSEADANHVKAALEKTEFLVVQDIFMTETAELADVVLPAASFAEKDGTFTCSERRVQRVRKAIVNVGESRGDWEIICDLAQRLNAKGFDFKTSEEIMQEVAKLAPIYGGITYKRIEKAGIQWPCSDEKHPGTKFLHKDKFATPNGKGKFMPLVYKKPMELPDKEYPLILTTDRSLYHFHTGTMTRAVEGLNVLMPCELVEINPVDAENLQIKDSEEVRVISRRGEIKVKTKITDTTPPGVVAMTFHFAESPTNVLTNCAIDPVAKIPETKVCAVRIEK